MTKLLLRILYVTFLVIVQAFTSRANNIPSLKKWGYAWEEYDSTLFYRLQNVGDLLSYADSALGVNARHSRAYSEFLAGTIRKRFFHGYSYYSIADNWLAWLAGVTFWDHLHAVVLPDDIMKFPNAACSQQAIVLKECFLAIGIAYREVNLTGHFVLEGKVEGQWLLFDTNLEPRFSKGRKSLEALTYNNELGLAYKHILSPQRLQVMFSNPIYKKENAPIAQNGVLFQQITGFLSKVLPLVLPLSLIFYFILRKKREPAVSTVRFVAITTPHTLEKVES